MRVMLVSVPRMPADTRTARATPPQGGYATVPVPWSTFDYIERRSVTEPDAPLIVEADGITHTYADAAHAIGEWSGWLDQESGRRLVRVAGLLENTAVPHLLRVAAAHAGVAYTSLSPLLRGKTLLDALDRSGITDVVVSGDDALRRLGLDARVGDLPVISRSPHPVPGTGWRHRSAGRAPATRWFTHPVRQGRPSRSESRLS
jgi:hypothetical protein